MFTRRVDHPARKQELHAVPALLQNWNPDPSDPVQPWLAPGAQVVPLVTTHDPQLPEESHVCVPVPLDVVHERVVPEVQTVERVQMPAEQNEPLVAQIRPQPPQLFVSVDVFTHAEPHRVFGEMHVAVQTPAEQDCPEEQIRPQPPQLFTSVAVFTQSEPHATLGDAHEVVQAPLEQV